MADEKDMPDWIAVAEQSGFSRAAFDEEQAQERSAEMAATLRDIIRLTIEIEARKILGGTDDI